MQSKCNTHSVLGHNLWGWAYRCRKCFSSKLTKGRPPLNVKYIKRLGTSLNAVRCLLSVSIYYHFCLFRASPYRSRRITGPRDSQWSFWSRKSGGFAALILQAILTAGSPLPVRLKPKKMPAEIAHTFVEFEPFRLCLRLEDLNRECLRCQESRPIGLWTIQIIWIARFRFLNLSRTLQGSSGFGRNVRRSWLHTEIVIWMCANGYNSHFILQILWNNKMRLIRYPMNPMLW